MSLFKDAFQKAFLGTKGDQAAVVDVAVELDEGFIMESGVPTEGLSVLGAPYTLGPGTFGLFSNENWESLAIGDLSGNNCCPLVLASASLKANDKQGPQHGGYLESNKSKYINPKRITKFYRVDSCLPQQQVVHIGNTNFTNSVVVSITDGGTGYTDGDYENVPMTGGTGSGMTADITIAGGVITAIAIASEGSGYVVGDVLAPDENVVGTPAGAAQITIDVYNITAGCCKTFYCDETYYLRLDIKGSPALRFANHNVYQTLDASGGCCDGAVPTPVDSTLIFKQWAEAILDSAYFVPFIKPVVFDQEQNPWFATAEDAVAAGWPATQIIENYVSPGYQEGACGGLRLIGAYTDTQFQNCTFELTDHYEIQPVRIYASLVDYTGDPCVFEGLCVVTECPSRQGIGWGEAVVREILLSESYLTNFFHTNKRIREITQGDQLLGSVDRFTGYYTRYYIQHNVPQHANNSQTYDNQQYLLEIITAGQSAGFEAFMAQWLDDCGDCATLEEQSCASCTPAALPTPTP